MHDTTRPLNPSLSLTELSGPFAEVLTGMHSVRIETLAPQPLFKFSRKEVPSASWLASPWWFTAQEFGKLQRYLEIDPGNPGFIGRTQAAVKYGRNDMNLLLTAWLTRPINVFLGPGVWQVERTKAGATIVYQAPQDLLQCYIPGLKSTQPDPAVQSAIVLVDHKPLPGPDDIDRAILNLTGGTVVLRGNPLVH